MSSYERINWKNYPSAETPINDANLNIMDEGIKKAHDGENMPIFTSSDALDTKETPLEWSDIEVLQSGEKHSLILAKISAMFKNVRYLYKKVTELDSNLFDKIYPVGSYYLAHNGTSPAEHFGGTWTRIAGQFLYAEGDDAWIGNTGGSSTLDFYHKHYSTIGYDTDNYYIANIWGTNVVQTPNGGTGWNFHVNGSGESPQVRVNLTSEGLDLNNQPINSKSIMPPYVRVAVWRRVA